MLLQCVKFVSAANHGLADRGDPRTGLRVTTVSVAGNPRCVVCTPCLCICAGEPLDLTLPVPLWSRAKTIAPELDLRKDVTNWAASRTSTTPTTILVGFTERLTSRPLEGQASLPSALLAKTAFGICPTTPGSSSISPRETVRGLLLVPSISLLRTILPFPCLTHFHVLLTVRSAAETQPSREALHLYPKRSTAAPERERTRAVNGLMGDRL